MTKAEKDSGEYGEYYEEQEFEKISKIIKREREAETRGCRINLQIRGEKYNNSG